MLVLLLATNATADTKTFCEVRKSSLSPLFDLHYRTYDQDHYMSLWCVRNSENLYRSLLRNGLVSPEKSYAVYMIHRNEDSSVFPMNARYGAGSWSNHAVLIIDGFVLDQDFEASPTILPLNDYLARMWGERTKDLVFQVRKAEQIDDYTNYGIRGSIRRNEYLVTNADGLARFFGQEPCSGNKLR